MGKYIGPKVMYRTSTARSVRQDREPNIFQIFFCLAQPNSVNEYFKIYHTTIFMLNLIGNL